MIRGSCLQIIVSIFVTLIVSLGGLKVITLSAEKFICKTLPDSCDVEDFSLWFAKPETPRVILGLNPGIKEIEILSEELYRCKLAETNFPGLTVSSTVNINVDFDGYSTLYCTIGDSDIEQDIKGPSLLVRLLSSILPVIRSRNIIKFDKENAMISNDAILEIDISLPSWFPVSQEAAKNGTSKVIEDNMESDLTSLLDNLVAAFESRSL